MNNGLIEIRGIPPLANHVGRIDAVLPSKPAEKHTIIGFFVLCVVQIKNGSACEIASLRCSRSMHWMYYVYARICIRKLEMTTSSESPGAHEPQ